MDCQATMVGGTVLFNHKAAAREDLRDKPGESKNRSDVDGLYETQPLLFQTSVCSVHCL